MTQPDSRALAAEIAERLRGQSSEAAREGMARFGINPERALGISVPVLRAVAKEIGRDHDLALELWASGIHEVMILATMVDEAAKVSEEQTEEWAASFNSWDLCDQCIMNLFEDLPNAYDKAVQWIDREEEYVRRAGYVMMARLAVSDKKAPDDRFVAFLDLIARKGDDPRNYVKKAVSWALRQIGKRNIALNRASIEAAERMLTSGGAGARWAAADSLRELKSAAVHDRLTKGR